MDLTKYQPKKKLQSLPSLFSNTPSLSLPKITTQPPTPTGIQTGSTAPVSSPIYPTPTGAPVVPQINNQTPTTGSTTPPPPPITSPTTTPTNPTISSIYSQVKGIQDSINNLATKPGTPPTTPQAPETPEPTAAETARSLAEKSYTDSLNISPEENTAQAELDRLTSSFRQGYTGIQDKVIPMEFITGQLQSLESRATNLAVPLEQKLAREQAKRIAAQSASKFALERADKKVEAETPFELGGQLVQRKADGSYATVFTPKDTEVLSPNEAAALGVPYGTTKADAAAMGILPKGQLTGQDKIDLEVKLAGQFEQYAKESRTAIRGVETVQTGFDEAMTALEEGKPLNAQSQAVIIGFNKLIDPTSVVRESEYARTPEGASLVNRLEGKIQQLTQGGAGLNATELQGLKDTAIALLDGYKNQQLNFAKRIQTQAKNYELNIENILTPDVLNLLQDNQPKTLQEYYQQNPQDRTKVEQMIQDNPNLSDDEILQILGGSGGSFSTVGGDTDRIASAIAQVESGGDYNAVGPDTGNGKAYGKYQIMDFNIPDWTREALGRSMTPQEFISNPEAQDKVAKYKIAQYVEQYGNPEDVASLWFSGRPLTKAGNSADVTGTTTPEYVKRVLKYLG